MQIRETCWKRETGWEPALGNRGNDADLVLYFGSRDALESGGRFEELRTAFPSAVLFGCSGTRTIVRDSIEEDVIAAAVISFKAVSVRLASERVDQPSDSYAAGVALGETIAGEDLAATIVLADGLLVDGSALAAGLQSSLGIDSLIIGGMASDPRDYRAVLVGADDSPAGGIVAAVGLYGTGLRVSHARASGWEPFGPRRRITRSVGNVLFDLDDKPALELYERYLGEEMVASAASDGVIIPLQITSPENFDKSLVRAPLAINDCSASMTFAGHVPEGWIARLMRGNTDRLILSAGDAARRAHLPEEHVEEQTLALIVSCAGRHQVMRQRTDEEIEVIGAELGPRATRIGFYSFGEIAPLETGGCEVHNQSITITSFREAVV